MEAPSKLVRDGHNNSADACSRRRDSSHERWSNQARLRTFYILLMQSRTRVARPARDMSRASTHSPCTRLSNASFVPAEARVTTGLKVAEHARATRQCTNHPAISISNSNARCRRTCGRRHSSRVRPFALRACAMTASIANAIAIVADHADLRRLTGRRGDRPLRTRQRTRRPIPVAPPNLRRCRTSTHGDESGDLLRSISSRRRRHKPAGEDARAGT